MEFDKLLLITIKVGAITSIGFFEVPPALECAATIYKEKEKPK